MTPTFTVLTANNMDHKGMTAEGFGNFLAFNSKKLKLKFEANLSHSLTKRLEGVIERRAR